MTAPADAMLQIPLSRIGSAQGFADRLEAHRAALANHRIGEPDQPAPIAPADHDLLDALILRVPESGPVEGRGPDRFEIAPYKIVDDTPRDPEPPTLAQRKQALLIELHNAGQAAIDKMVSPARARLLGMQYADTQKKAKSKRTVAEKATVKKFSTYVTRAGEINRVITLAAVAIEDLTEKNIHDWKPPSFD